MAGQEINKCTVCSCEFTDDEGGVHGDFGMLPVSFCPTCFSCMCDMAQQFIDPAAFEEESNPEYENLIQHLKGVQKVVINKCYGGFGLSRDATMLFLKYSGIEYELVEQPDRERQTKYGSKIYVNGMEFHSQLITRTDPALIAVVSEMGAAANGPHAELKIVKIPSNVDWMIEDYDGREWVGEVHRTWD